MNLPSSLRQLTQLEGSKVELERVNDSLQVQLEEASEREQGAEEEGAVLRQEAEEAQAALVSSEDEIRVYQQELSETQVCGGG